MKNEGIRKELEIEPITSNLEKNTKNTYYGGGK